MKQIEFIISGETSEELADELIIVYNKWRKNPGSLNGKNKKKRLTIRVCITGIRRETSIEHCIRYACGEIRDGIIQAGGTIWDGTHVQIMLYENRWKI